VQIAFRIGIAGWAIPSLHAALFPGERQHLARYAQRFTAVEINSSFYRPHRPTTYARWAATVPADFRFAVKLPREITHRRKLVDTTEPLDRFLAETAVLGDRRGPLLIQLPPSLAYTEAVVLPFLEMLRTRFGGALVCEPRHESWFTDPVDGALMRLRIARVAADPAMVSRAAMPGGWPGLAYYRLHGAPKMYYSPYAPEQLDALAATLRAAHKRCDEVWCIFDNTARYAATADALGLIERLSRALS
jgi:uncharacterized protein YecE (DUF72 family)